MSCSIFHSMCYSFYKIGKKKRLSGGPQEQIDNQYDSQPNEMSCSNPITVNASYTKQAAVTARSCMPHTLDLRILCMKTYSLVISDFALQCAVILLFCFNYLGSALLCTVAANFICAALHV